MGHFGEISLILSQIISWYGIIWFKQRSDFLVFSVRLALLALTASLVSLSYAFLTHDFDLIYVAEHSHRALPWFYRVSALWGGHEGSYLLWLWLIYVWSVLSFSLRQNALSARALWYALIIGASMGAYLLFMSSPFTPFVPAGPDNGQDLNPLLQDPGMIIHPPILYIGYVGFVVPMCYVLAYFHEGQKFDVDWIRLKQVAIRVTFWLTLGIALGSWWAYRELGWGGFWFWDPVENASLMPWLLGVGLIHMLKIASHDRSAHFWVLAMALMGFILSVLGSFLVRSGVLISVHTFASDPGRGSALLLILFGLCVLSTGLLMRYQGHNCQTSRISRRDFLAYGGSLLMMFVLAVVLLGTLYPLIVTSMGWGEVSVGAAYFNEVLLPVVVIGCLLISFIDHRISRERIALQIVLSAAFFYVYWPQSWMFGLMAFLILWAIVSQLTSQLAGSIKLAHVGILSLLLGVSMHGDLSRSYEVAISENQVFTEDDLSVRLLNVQEAHLDNYDQAQFYLMVQNQSSIHLMKPQRRYYASRDQVMNKSDIVLDGLTDVYAVMGDRVDEVFWSMRLYFKPGIIFIWLGAVLMALGLILRSFRVKK
jgi:cytochrome c-type biogenesis protein CcmF